MKQLCLFSHKEMQGMVRVRYNTWHTTTIRIKRVKPVEKKKVQFTDNDIAIMAMQDCMRDGGWDGPETAEELCSILGFL